MRARASHTLVQHGSSLALESRQDVHGEKLELCSHTELDQVGVDHPVGNAVDSWQMGYGIQGCPMLNSVCNTSVLTGMPARTGKVRRSARGWGGDCRYAQAGTWMKLAPGLTLRLS